jgi:hypothetical protein
MLPDARIFNLIEMSLNMEHEIILQIEESRVENKASSEKE